MQRPYRKQFVCSFITSLVLLYRSASTQNLNIGELLQREALIDTSLLQIEEKMVETRLDVMRYAKYKVRFEIFKTGVDYVLVENLEKRFEQVRDLVVYCFVNDIMTVVELGKYKDFLQIGSISLTMGNSSIVATIHLGKDIIV